MEPKAPIEEPTPPKTEQDDKHRRSWPQAPSDMPDEPDGHRGLPGINEPEMPAQESGDRPEKAPRQSQR